MSLMMFLKMIANILLSNKKLLLNIILYLKYNGFFDIKFKNEI